MQNGFINGGEPDQELIIAALPKVSLSFYKNEQTDKVELILNGQNVENKIRTPEVANQVSKIAAIKEVREKLVEEQQKMGVEGGIIMDGRDIGSVVFPFAELKLFVTAAPEIRAKRRWYELKQQGIEISEEEVLKNLTERDFLDTTRSESPLIQTQDAIVIDTTDLTPESQLQLAYDLAIRTISNKNKA
jgi:cytidylate kinase